MRASDQNKHFNSHDKQIYDSVHDKIVLWTYEKLKDKDWVYANILNKKSLLERMEDDLKSIKHGGSYHARGKELGEYELCLDTSIEAPIEKSGYKFMEKIIVGFADLSLFIKLTTKTDAGELCHLYERVNFEVKSSVNIGETIRQINYYSQHSSNWMVVAPPFPQSVVLEEQRIPFIPYMPNN
jgi:hypothetical protein